MNAEQVKPSQAHGNADVLRAKADAANRKRNQRKAEQARQEQADRNQRKAEQARQEQADRIKREAEEQARQEREAEEERVRQEEEKMWSEVKKETKAEKKAYKQGKIRTRVDGIEFDSLAKAMAHIDPVLWGKESDYRTSCWIKINRALKKEGVCVYGGHKYELIK